MGMMWDGLMIKYAKEDSSMVAGWDIEVGEVKKL